MAATAASKRGKLNGQGLKWPGKLRRTSMREQWHRRLSDLPTGLSIRELAERLGDAYPTVSFWAKVFKYPFRRVPRGRKSEVAWASADWSRKNSELAKDLGVSGERVRQMRQQLKLPPAPRCSEGGMEFRKFVRKNVRRLHQWSIREMITMSGADISTATAHVILQQYNGYRKTNGNGKTVVTSVDRKHGRGVVAAESKKKGRA